ncbi:DNA primase [Denitratisoma oestradiolicum]|uniref:DNA primase n=1 Tax=Denitratisoma oestradiolicum TaxID=311182 RepID=A0A6S6XXD1_9PROT|nr:DNA primase [Denitratisoma oestradiolicum]TWO81696.1 DNA primase [Denitratisoma oestradiolicum]CAB1370644.1 DNA primase [Denitratisoma oestradiolicum]
MIPESFIQDLLARVDIVGVVESYVPLRKAGANYSACCPFHSEKTPSFTVSPSKQFYHCFGCGAHGSAIGFVMQYSGLGFIDAVEELAGRAGMQVPREASSIRRVEEVARKAPLTELMARAMKFYRDQLKDSPKAIDYLKVRGLTGEIAARFGLGYAPDNWQGLEKIFPNYNDDALVECGLIIVNEQGRRYDRFRDRIMFPIIDPKGNVIGFGGRVIGAGEPKYLNSPETPLFQKGYEVYGLPQARKAIHGEDRVIVVEGYMDVVGLAQSGVENTVATLGTAATGTNVQKLLRQASRVVFCFDRDAAGDKAAWRAMEVSLEFLVDNKSVEILQMSGNQDPDEFVREHGREAFMVQLNNATKLSEFLVRGLKERTRPYTAEGRAQLIHEAKPLLQRIAAPVLRVQLTKAIAELAQLSQAEVEAQCELKPLARSRSAPLPSRSRTSPRSIEHALLEIVLQKPEWSLRLPLELISSDQPEGAAIHAVADAMDHGELAAGGVGLLLELFRGHPQEAIVSTLAAQLAVEEPDVTALESVLNDALAKLRQVALRREIDALTTQARQGTLGPDARQQLAELLARKGGETTK